MRRSKRSCFRRTIWLTGFPASFCTDYSDASGMLLLDVKNRRWSKEMLEICGMTEEQLAEAL